MPDRIGNTLQQLNEVFQRQRNDPFSQTYNPGWENHPNFSWDQGGFQGNQHGAAQFAGPIQGQYQFSNQFPYNNQIQAPISPNQQYTAPV